MRACRVWGSVSFFGFVGFSRELNPPPNKKSKRALPEDLVKKRCGNTGRLGWETSPGLEPKVGPLDGGIDDPWPLIMGNAPSFWSRAALEVSAGRAQN